MASLPATGGAAGGDSDQVIPSPFTLRGDHVLLFSSASAPIASPAASASAATTAHSTNPSPSIAGQKATRRPVFSNTVFP